jgi:hypothetical protein
MLRFADVSRELDQTWLKWARDQAPKLLDGAFCDELGMAARHVERWLPSGAAFMGA